MKVRVTPGVRSATAIALTAAFLAGCANTHSVVVGGMPDDYRTNHPIVVAEEMRTVDIPVGYSDRGANRVQISTLDGFMARYDQSAKPVVRVLVPSGSANAYAASAVAADLVQRLRQGGLPDGYILHQPYQAAPDEDQAPIRIAFSAMTASTGPCGRWDDDLMNHRDNKHYTNFGCASQNNLAAQVANPADFLTPRRSGPIDPRRRERAIEEYQTGEGRWDSEIDY